MRIHRSLRSLRRPPPPAAVLCAAAFALAAGAGLSTSGPDGQLRTERLRGDVWLVRGEGGNSIVRLSRDGTLIVDAKTDRGGRLLQETALRLARENGTDKRVHRLFLTHSHPEQAGGRGLFGKALVVATDKTAERLDSGRSDGLPTVSFTTRATFRLVDGEVVTCHHKGAGHTDGDMVVHFGDAHILALGGLVANGLHPAFLPDHGADARSWIRVLEGLRRDFGKDDDLIVVPADGPAGGIELLDAQIEYLRRIVDLVDDAVRRGQSMDELMQRAQTLRDANAGIGGDRGHFERTLRALYDQG